MRPIVCVYDGLRAICSEKRFAVPFLAELWAFKRNEKEKSLDNQGIFLFKNWRRGRDSNPRYAINVYTLSRRATSTTHPPLRKKAHYTDNFELCKMMIRNVNAFAGWVGDETFYRGHNLIAVLSNLNIGVTML